MKITILSTKTRCAMLVAPILVLSTVAGRAADFSLPSLAGVRQSLGAFHDRHIKGYEFDASSKEGLSSFLYCTDKILDMSSAFEGTSLHARVQKGLRQEANEGTLHGAQHLSSVDARHIQAQREKALDLLAKMEGAPEGTSWPELRALAQNRVDDVMYRAGITFHHSPDSLRKPLSAEALEKKMAGIRDDFNTLNKEHGLSRTATQEEFEKARKKYLGAQDQQKQESGANPSNDSK